MPSVLSVVTSMVLEGVWVPPYFNQGLFIAAVAVLPQIVLEWSSKAATGGRIAGLYLICLVSLPLGFTAWSLANIGIVKVKEARIGGMPVVALEDVEVAAAGGGGEEIIDLVQHDLPALGIRPIHQGEVGAAVVLFQ